jgi:ferredoxin
VTRKRPKLPTYEQDRVGPISRWDERDIVFARADLFRYFGDGSPQRAEYYEVHPERREFDERVAGMPGVGLSAADHAPLIDATFGAARAIAAERFVDGELAREKSLLSPGEAARRVKARARALGADLVGTGPLRQEWVYSHVGRSFGNAGGFVPWGAPVDLSHHTDAIAMGFRMDYDLLRTAPAFPTIIATGTAYAIGTWVSIRLAQYIRSLGYSARAHHMYNYRVLVVPVAVDCGLGELSRAGFLITREFGLGLRLGVVTTDLPLTHDGPVDIGVQSFCERCEICAENCPSGAIPSGEKAAYNGVRKWKLDEERCYHYWHLVGTDCAICMSTCPWTKPPSWLHRTMLPLATFRGPHQSLMAVAERLFYGRPPKRDVRHQGDVLSIHPTRLREQIPIMAAVVAALLGIGIWWGGWGAPAPLTAWAWVVYLAWLLWSALGVAVVWTLFAEREPRAAGVGLALFGGISAVLWGVLTLLGILP